MVKEVTPITGIKEEPPLTNEFRRFVRVFFSRGVVIFGLVIIIALISIAVFAPLLAPYDPIKPDLRATLQKPSSKHLLGTDALGRDTFYD